MTLERKCSGGRLVVYKKGSRQNRFVTSGKELALRFGSEGSQLEVCGLQILATGGCSRVVLCGQESISYMEL